MAEKSAVGARISTVYTAFGAPATSRVYGPASSTISAVPARPTQKNNPQALRCKAATRALSPVARYLLTSPDKATGKAPNVMACTGINSV